MGLSLSHLVLLAFIILVLFGAGKLPQVMSDLAKGIKAFKDSLNGDKNSDKNKDDKN